MCKKKKESYPKYTQNALSLKPVWRGKPVITKEKWDVQGKKGIVRKSKETYPKYTQNAHSLKPLR